MDLLIAIEHVSPGGLMWVKPGGGGLFFEHEEKINAVKIIIIYSMCLFIDNGMDITKILFLRLFRFKCFQSKK